MHRRTFLKVFSTLFLAHGLPPASIVRAFQSFDNTNTQSVIPSGDILLPKEDWPHLLSTIDRFSRIQATAGFGNFCILGLDDSLKIARNYSKIGQFSSTEINFLEKLFETDAKVYGFLGKKTLHNLSHSINSSHIQKIPGTGNHVFKGPPQQLYQQISHDIGDRVVLTAGIRGMAKQFYLFLKKVKKTQGNLSMASQAIAPPGYSYHGIGDFDVGQIGFGAANFTVRFSHTDVYKKMTQLGYVLFRYPQNNRLGVQFEPWHIQVV